MGISQVTRNYQVTLPADVRNIENIKIGDKLLFSVKGNTIIVKKMERRGITDKTFGSWKGEIKGSSVEYVRKMREESEKRLKRLGL